MSYFELRGLDVGFKERLVVKDLNLIIPEGKITVLIGANGCGKSTLLSTLARQRAPLAGEVLFGGRRVERFKSKEAARQIAFMPQVNETPEGLTVEQLVRFGRYPHQTFLKRYTEQDEEAVSKALRLTETDGLRERLVSELSGGQRQRVWLALALAQETDTILLDEPTTYLDMTHQIDVLDLMYRLNREEGKTIIMVLHDLQLTCRYADHIIALANGRLHAEGTPETIISRELIKNVFDLEVKVIKYPIYVKTFCIPYSKR